MMRVFSKLRSHQKQEKSNNDLDQKKVELERLKVQQEEAQKRANKNRQIKTKSPFAPGTNLNDKYKTTNKNPKRVTKKMLDDKSDQVWWERERLKRETERRRIEREEINRHEERRRIEQEEINRHEERRRIEQEEIRRQAERNRSEQDQIRRQQEQRRNDEYR